MPKVIGVDLAGLPKNDTGDAPGHQGGLVVPIELRAFFPTLTGGTTSITPTIDYQIRAILYNGSDELAVVLNVNVIGFFSHDLFNWRLPLPQLVTSFKLKLSIVKLISLWVALHNVVSTKDKLSNQTIC